MIFAAPDVRTIVVRFEAQQWTHVGFAGRNQREASSADSISSLELTLAKFPPVFAISRECGKVRAVQTPLPNGAQFQPDFVLGVALRALNALFAFAQFGFIAGLAVH